MVDFIKRIFGITKSIKNISRKNFNVDILKDIRSDKTIADLLNHEKANSLISVISLNAARTILKRLCSIYDLKELDEIDINPDIGCVATFRCCYNNKDVAKISNLRILFRDRSCLIVTTIFHEFSHYLDAVVNPYYRQTTPNGGVYGCNQIIPDTFARIYFESLQNKEYEQAA